MLQEKLKKHHIILASGSPRRHQFLEELGVPFTVKLKPVDEIYPNHLNSWEITNYLSELKAKVFADELQVNDILITSDTIVWHENKALGKPENSVEAFEMIKSLSGKTHEVITSVTFTTQNFQKTVNSSTEVTFMEIGDEEITYYVDNFKPLDKAGAYGIQEWIGLIGISRVEGSYFNVVGLPTHLVYKTLIEIASGDFS